jgi:microcystin-dependent protein
MADPFIGMIVLFSGNFAPRGWAFCDGQLLAIAQNQALFSILGTTYGGNGQTTFALPDLRGRVPIGPRQGSGLTNRDLGETGGSESVTLTTNQMPLHTHGLTLAMNVKNAAGNSRTPVGGVLANEAAGVTATYSTATPDSGATMSSGALTGAVGTAGGSQPAGIMQPYLGMNYIIALEGIFPSRN